uniref:Uncharacterized protein n=1 Tax=Panagrolaimus sp. PS1159 TaxID=55785 RepID=A0AC35F2H8_9BILA
MILFSACFAAKIAGISIATLPFLHKHLSFAFKEHGRIRFPHFKQIGSMPPFEDFPSELSIDAAEQISCKCTRGAALSFK